MILIVPQWLYDSLVKNDEDVSDLMPVGSWIYDKNDTSPEALTMRLHERWGGTSFLRISS